MNTTKTTHLGLISVARYCLVALLMCAGLSNSSAAIKRWNGAAAGNDNNWGTSGNWSASGAPGSLDDAWFGNFDTTGTAGPTGNSNNIVDVSRTVKSLWYTNTTLVANQVHTTEIPAGVTLTVSGAATDPQTGASQAMLVGMTVEVAANSTNYTTIKGGGALTVNNSVANITVRVPGGASSLHRGTLDLSGLNTFNATVNQLLVGGDGLAGSGTLRRAWGTMTLAKTNVVTLAGNPAMIIGGYTSCNLADGVVRLGNTNLFLADGEVYVGSYRSNGRLQFDPANANPVAVFRGLDGVSRSASVWYVGWNRGISATPGRESNGTVDLTGGTVDGLITSLYVGRGQNYNNAAGLAAGRGDFAMSKGVLDVLDVSLGQRRVNYGALASGTITVGNSAQLIVRDFIEFGLDRLIDPTNGPCSGTLNITNGGFVWVKGDMYDSGFGTNIININGGHLKVGGYLSYPTFLYSFGRPFDEIDLTNATLTLRINSSINSTNPVGAVTNLNIATTNTINVQAGGLMGLGQYPLIQYFGGGIGGDGFAVVGLGKQPNRHLGYLTHNLATTSIDYVLTNVSAAKWDGTVNGDWNISGTTNWVDLVATAPTVYQEDEPPGDPVLFDDTASGTTTVNVVTNVSPTVISFTNSSKTYVFTGPNKITGTTSLNKNGNGLVILTNSGANDFSGAVNLNAGTLRLGLAADRLPVAANVNLADIAGTALELGDVDQTLATINGGGPTGGGINLGAAKLTTTGSSTYNGKITGPGMFQKNAGTLNLGGSNTYTGGTVLVSGTTRLINTSGSGLGTGPVTIAAGTLSIGSGGPGGNLASGLAFTNNGALTFDTTDDLLGFTNAMYGAGTLNKNNTNTVILAADSTYTGATAINDGSLRITAGGALGTPTGATSIGTGVGSRLELMGNITVPENFSISQKGAANTALGATHFVNLSGTNTLTGTITGGSGGSYWTFRSSGGKLVVNGTFVLNTTSDRYIRLEGDADGDWITPFSNGSGIGRIYKAGTGTWSILGTNTYTGNTVCNGGRVIVNGQIQSPANVYVGDWSSGLTCTLGGTGQIASAVFVDTNSVFSPGNSIGTITINNTLTMFPGCTNVFDVNTDTLEHDLATGMSSVTYAGTLVINPSGFGTAITNGASAQLFSAASYSGAFEAIVPASPGPGLFWDTTQLTVNGTLGITNVAGINTTSTNLGFAVVGNSLNISWPADQIGWRLEGQTNGLNIGVSNNWFTVPGSATTNQVFLPLNPANGSVFYRLIYP